MRSDETWAHLAPWLSSERRLDWFQIGVSIRETLPMMRSEKQLDSKAMTTTEIRVALVGEVEEPDVARELDMVFGQLVGPRGRVQWALGNAEGDPRLCSKRVPRKFNGGGEVTRIARFVTKEPALIVKYLYEYQAAALRQHVEGFRELVEFGTANNAELVAELRPLLDRTNQHVVQALPRAA